jgi:predicted site-specific integrase-resolvase
VLQATRKAVHHQQRLGHAEAGWCRQRSRQQTGEIQAIHRVSQASLGELLEEIFKILKIFEISIFSKNRKTREIVQNAHKTKNF